MVFPAGLLRVHWTMHKDFDNYQDVQLVSGKERSPLYLITLKALDRTLREKPETVTPEYPSLRQWELSRLQLVLINMVKGPKESNLLSLCDHCFAEAKKEAEVAKSVLKRLQVLRKKNEAANNSVD